MKAVLFPKYGSPDVLQLTEVDKPSPNENQVLIKVIAALAFSIALVVIGAAP